MNLVIEGVGFGAHVPAAQNEFAESVTVQITLSGGQKANVFAGLASR